MSDAVKYIVLWNGFLYNTKSFLLAIWFSHGLSYMYCKSADGIQGSINCLAGSQRSSSQRSKQFVRGSIT